MKFRGFPKHLPHLAPFPRSLDTSSSPPPRIPVAPPPRPHAPLALAERILDLCLEKAARDGAAPDLLTTR